MGGAAKIAVVGSVNLDIAASVSRLPVPGETVTGARLQRFPGGKGANQALAAQRLGAQASLLACVGDDANADEALRLLREGGVDLSLCRVCDTSPTGVALICIDDQGENQIVVAPGANRSLSLGIDNSLVADALICQLEVPVDVLLDVASSFTGFFCANLAPAMPVPETLIERADLIVVNQTESEFYGSALDSCNGLIVRTLGAGGAEALRSGVVVARASSPAVSVVDTTGAGDTFTAAITVALVSGIELDDALAFACTAGALATTRAGAQPSLPMRADVETMLQ